MKMSLRKNRLLLYTAGTLLGIVTTAAAAALFSAAMWSLQLDVRLAGAMSLLSLGAGCLAAGLVTGFYSGRSGLLSGTKAGLCLLVLLAAASLFTGNIAGDSAVGKIVTCVLCGGAGGALGINRND